jgi:hypothetical protein
VPLLTVFFGQGVVVTVFSFFSASARSEAFSGAVVLHNTGVLRRKHSVMDFLNHLMDLASVPFQSGYLLFQVTLSSTLE